MLEEWEVHLCAIGNFFLPKLNAMSCCCHTHMPKKHEYPNPSTCLFSTNTFTKYGFECSWVRAFYRRCIEWLANKYEILYVLHPSYTYHNWSLTQEHIKDYHNPSQCSMFHPWRHNIIHNYLILLISWLLWLITNLSRWKTHCSCNSLSTLLSLIILLIGIVLVVNNYLKKLKYENIPNHKLTKTVKLWEIKPWTLGGTNWVQCHAISIILTRYCLLQYLFWTDNEILWSIQNRYP